MPKIAPVASERRNAERKKAREKEMRQAQHFILRHELLHALDEANQPQLQDTMLQLLEGWIDDEVNAVRKRQVMLHCYRTQMTFSSDSCALELERASKRWEEIERERVE